MIVNSSLPLPGGTWTLGDTTVTRFGYGAMQLAGPWVMGPPADPVAARAVLRDVIELGITHIDTSDAYGPRVTNELIRETLHPYPESLFIATKVGATRDAEGGWPPARKPEDVRRFTRTSVPSASRRSTSSTCGWATRWGCRRVRSPRRWRRSPSCSGMD